MSAQKALDDLKVFVKRHEGVVQAIQFLEKFTSMENALAELKLEKDKAQAAYEASKVNLDALNEEIDRAIENRAAVHKDCDLAVEKAKVESAKLIHMAQAKSDEILAAGSLKAAEIDREIIAAKAMLSQISSDIEAKHAELAAVQGKIQEAKAKIAAL